MYQLSVYCLTRITIHVHVEFSDKDCGNPVHVIRPLRFLCSSLNAGPRVCESAAAAGISRVSELWKSRHFNPDIA